jgi:histidinol-phosphate aminotransferase
MVSAGVLIRDVGLANALRVTIGTPEENDRFIAAINAALTES